MLAVEPLRGSGGEDRDGAMGSFSVADVDFADEALLEDISFGDLFLGIDHGDVLPDLELDPAEIFAEFSVGEEHSGSTTAWEAAEGMLGVDGASQDVVVAALEEHNGGRGEEVVSAMTREESMVMPSRARPSSPDGNKGRTPSAAAAAKGSHRKRKAKVDWTPELHRRFVQAVEQLGIDKAVPSRILELMGIDCLTRHNIASHLQKYRSHRKHLLAREAEAVSWSQRRQVYATGAGAKRDINPWVAPTIGFVPPTPAAPPSAVQLFRPLHVWGHPTTEAPLVHMWLRHLAPRSPTVPWAPQPPPSPPDPAYWHHHYQRGSREGWFPRAMTQGTPCFAPPLPTAVINRFPAPHVPGIAPHPMYRPPPPVVTKRSSSQLHLDAHPSMESVDAAIGDVLAQPWLPLPLGLKSPSMDSVLVELQKKGVQKVPPACG
ncbi:probable transcription factor GLK1 isoform X2 [Musa acuminata AAA Group]|uniref:probable transcription factor GLK1 isoform X2 n=1 Tax=Musa acuminata AAA Group TaxID=214697 RepID=UPI0031D44C3C